MQTTSPEQCHSLVLDNPFWAYSLTIWALPNAQQALLALQDDFDCRINALLFACWTGSLGQSLQAQLIQAIENSASWHRDTVTPLRAVRRGLRQEMPEESRQSLVPQKPLEAFKQAMLAAELQAEQIEQALFYDFYCRNIAGEKIVDTVDKHTQRQATTDNLLSYIRHVQHAMPAPAPLPFEELSQLMSDCLSKTSKHTILDYLKGHDAQ